MKGNGRAGGPSQGPPAPDGDPEHPGFIVRREYLEQRGLSERVAADRLDLSLRTLNELVCGKRDMTWRTAAALEREGVRTAEQWMALQAKYDVWRWRQNGGAGGHAADPPS